MVFKLYNGCPNDELAAHWKSEDDAQAFLRANEFFSTYFPMEGMYGACRSDDYSPLGGWFSSRSAAADYLKSCQRAFHGPLPRPASPAPGV